MTFGRTVLVPVVNPANAMRLVGLAAVLASADGGTVLPFTVVDPRGPTDRLDAAWDLVGGAAGAVTADGGSARGLVHLHPSVATGVLEGVEDEGATLVLMGWEGVSTRQNVFDALIDTILGSSAVPLVVARLRERTVNRVLLAISDEDLLPAGRGGLRLAVQIADRVRTPEKIRLVVLRSGRKGELPDDVAALADDVRRDDRREDQALGDEAQPGDVIVIPVAPTESGLRTASTRTAWAAPDANLLVVVDPGRTAAH